VLPDRDTPACCWSSSCWRRAVAPRRHPSRASPTWKGPTRRSSGASYPLVLFEGGSVATWRQTPAGGEDPFFAKLAAEEQARAAELIAAIPAERSLARETFDASLLVMGVSTRLNEHVDTLYFESRRIPAALSELVSLMKQRLEATNRGL
jgi:hypothetical protein